MVCYLGWLAAIDNWLAEKGLKRLQDPLKSEEHYMKWQNLIKC